ncbi:hypothetical protein CRM22_002418 [Opisthorchis felineus]|uniref:TatD related DNase n=1 Tax=Opisthorchis felineus TaxID=147828 RepID=A0A4S2M634_OPIFE|nr:hypothetical protein CRM22_002418 [Opisthorchis felineus]
MIDTHCHLCDAAFKNDIEDVVLRAVTTGVRGVLTLTEERSDFSLALELKERFPDWINLGFGIHPMQKREDGSGLSRSVNLKDMDGVRELILKHAEQLVAIGEVGLDFSPCVCPTMELHAVQRAVLTQQIHLSKELNLPLNVHSRSASKPTLELLKSEGATRVQMHAFDGRPSVAMLGVQEGFYFSIPPCVLRSKQKQELVKAVPLTHLLLETDSPVLGVNPELTIPP